MRTEESRSFPARRGRLSRGRVIAIIAIACGALAAPGTARAADPFGVAHEVNAAMSEATSVVTQAVTAAPQAASPAPKGKSWDSAGHTSGTSPATLIASAAGKALEAAAQEAASATSAATESTVQPFAASGPPAEPSARVKRHASKRNARRVTSRRSVSVTLASESGEAFARASVTSSSTLVTGSARVERAGDARPRRTNPAGVAPQHLPPVPLPPRDVTTSGQAGGQGPLMPLVVGALAAVVLFLVFELMRRVLSRPAIRRPRRISFPPWHPG